MHTAAVQPILTAAEKLRARLPDVIARIAVLAGLARVIEPDADVTLVTGLEGPVDLAEPVTCRYCRRDIVEDDDHASDCCWHPGRAAAR